MARYRETPPTNRKVPSPDNDRSKTCAPIPSKPTRRPCRPLRQPYQAKGEHIFRMSQGGRRLEVTSQIQYNKLKVQGIEIAAVRYPFPRRQYQHRLVSNSCCELNDTHDYHRFQIMLLLTNPVWANSVCQMFNNAGYPILSCFPAQLDFRVVPRLVPRLGYSIFLRSWCTLESPRTSPAPWGFPRAVLRSLTTVAGRSRSMYRFDTFRPSTVSTRP